MEFGVCTNFAAEAGDPAGIGLMENVARAGFSYVELPLCQVEALSEGDFQRLRQQLEKWQLKAVAACNLFPEDMPLRGSTADREAIVSYLHRGFKRARLLGIRKVIFASVSAWNTDSDVEAARRELALLVREVIAPVCREYGICLLMEGIRRQVANVLNTLPEAGMLAKEADHPACGLMADLYHMLCNEEPETHLDAWWPVVEHVHIADRNRQLPGETVSPELAALITRLGSTGWQGQISFEVCGPLEPDRLVLARNCVLSLMK